jgi:signal transduction histidine kinase
MLALAFGIYSTARLVSNRRLRKRLLQLQHDGEMARERMRIAQDMHDEIGSKLAKISFLTEGVKAELRDIYKDTGVIDTLSRASRELLQSLDQMVWAVNPRNDTLENLAAYLCQYSADFFHDTPVVCELDFPQKLPPVVLSAETRHNIFLAVKEALTNALKHSAATKVCVKLMMEKNVLKLLILDNGRGLDVQSQFAGPEIVTANSRYGISGIRRRLQSINGEFLIQSIPGQGTTYIFTIAIKGLSASNSINETQLDSSLHR